MKPVRTVVLALALGGALPACGAAQEHTALNYGDRAHREYAAALQQFNNGDLLAAEESFRRVKRQYGMSRWGWLAELRIADIDFRKDNFTQAITEYRSWVRYHPNQPEVAYAHYMIAKSYFGQIPNDWLLVPPSWERDQSATHDAEEQLARFLEDYPESEYTRDSRELLRRVRELLARAEIQVAQYYLSRDRADAAISRLRGVLEVYPGSGLEPEALMRIGETYLQLNRRTQAHAAFTAIVTFYPASNYVTAARHYLQFIGPIPGHNGELSPAGLPPPPPVGS